MSGAPFSNAARNLRQLRNSPASWSFALLILAIQLAVTWGGGPELEPAATAFHEMGLSRDGLLAGKVWQLLTYGFLHGGWLHAGLNAAFILLIGSRVEYITGGTAMSRVVLAGVIGGGLAHLALAAGGDETQRLVGISGGCMALLLMLTTLSPQSRMMPLPVSGRSLGLGVLAAELILALADPALGVPVFLNLGNWLVGHGLGHWFQMGHACHFGGGVAGWLFGRWLLRPRINLERLRRDRERQEARESARVK